MDKKQINQESIDDNYNNKIKNVKNINNELYKTILLEEYIYLRPMDLNNKIEDIILIKLKKKVEGKCLKVGYVIHDSINIQTRSLGMINNASFDGMTTYKIKFTAEVCNPVIGQVIQCYVGSIDKSQVICYINELSNNSPLEIYLFKHHHVGNSEYNELKKGDLINVKIGGSKWEYKDTQINSIAQYIGKAIQ
jgi:DNA-directed RNA polymerase subunit E'/Rpb7